MSMTIRLATTDDLRQIESLMKRSMKALGVGYYSENQVDACCEYICVPDQQLIADKTYYVVLTDDSKMVGCGGWSCRKKLYAGPSETSDKADKLDPLKDPARIRAMFTDPNYSGKGIGSMILKQSETAAKTHGFSKGALGATLSGVPFYTAKGWEKLSKGDAVLPNGISIKVTQMTKNI